MQRTFSVFICLFYLYSCVFASDEAKPIVDCSTLRPGQYICPDPSINPIDPDTQQYKGCVKGKEVVSEGEAEGWLPSCQYYGSSSLSPMMAEQARQRYTREQEGIQCLAADGIICNETNNSTFRKKLPCKWTNGYSLEIALLLSVFLGMFGLDRFYLGYPGIGLAKLCTLGFMFLGQLLDIILIAAQVVGPADGSSYVVPYFGAGVAVVRSDNETYLLPQADWHNIT